MILFLVGFIAFLLAGFGLGGGVLLIPVLTEFFNFNQRAGQYFALVAYIPAAIGVIIYNFKSNKGDFYKILNLVPLGLVGTLIGSFVAMIINVDFLRKIYALFLIYFGLNMIFKAFFSLKKAKMKEKF